MYRSGCTGRSEVSEWGPVELVQNRGNGRPLGRTGTRSTDDVESPLRGVREKAEVRQHSAIHPGIVVHVPRVLSCNEVRRLRDARQRRARALVRGNRASRLPRGGGEVVARGTSGSAGDIMPSETKRGFSKSFQVAS